MRYKLFEYELFQYFCIYKSWKQCFIWNIASRIKISPKNLKNIIILTVNQLKNFLKKNLHFFLIKSKNFSRIYEFLGRKLLIKLKLFCLKSSERLFWKPKNPKKPLKMAKNSLALIKNDRFLTFFWWVFKSS